MTKYPEIHFKKSKAKYDWFELTNDCHFSLEGYSFIIPKGYTTDFASVPQIFWWLIPAHCNASMPAVVHDYTCEFGILPRQICDNIFLELLKKENIKKWQYTIMYLYVRALGWIRYDKRKKN